MYNIYKFTINKENDASNLNRIPFSTSSSLELFGCFRTLSRSHLLGTACFCPPLPPLSIIYSEVEHGTCTYHVWLIRIIYYPSKALGLQGQRKDTSDGTPTLSLWKLSNLGYLGSKLIELPRNLLLPEAGGGD